MEYAVIVLAELMSTDKNPPVSDSVLDSPLV